MANLCEKHTQSKATDSVHNVLSVSSAPPHNNYVNFFGVYVIFR